MDSGLTWTQANPPGEDSWLTVASSADGSKLVAVAASDIYGANGGHIYTLQFPLPPPPSPRLSISPLSGNLGLYWLVPSTWFVLQQNPDLSTTNWTDLPTPPALNFTNLHYEVKVSPSPGSRFYRLKHH
jgi:hypothetical protein